MGINGAARGCRQLLLGEEAGELLAGPGELRAAGVEDFGDGAPAGPPGQDAVFVGGGRAVFALDRPERGQGGEVGADAADGTRGRQVVLAFGAEGC